jgi:hypothetical protein
MDTALWVLTIAGGIVVAGWVIALAMGLWVAWRVRQEERRRQRLQRLGYIYPRDDW